MKAAGNLTRPEPIFRTLRMISSRLMGFFWGMGSSVALVGRRASVAEEGFPPVANELIEGIFSLMTKSVIFVVFGFMGLCGAVVVLLLAWLLSLPLGWLLGTDPVVSMAFALGSLGIMAVLFHAVTTQHPLSMPWRMAEGALDDEDDGSEEEGQPGGEGEQANWFRPCLCGSGKSFAQCCGKRAFKRERK